MSEGIEIGIFRQAMPGSRYGKGVWPVIGGSGGDAHVSFGWGPTGTTFTGRFVFDGGTTSG
jgi:hypothetical protein